jgi:hypothetical protein
VAVTLVELALDHVGVQEMVGLRHGLRAAHDAHLVGVQLDPHGFAALGIRAEHGPGGKVLDAARQIGGFIQRRRLAQDALERMAISPWLNKKPL